MIINNLELNNFGSYEGVNNFDFNTDENKNIILIGGKNGAGKTTLFTAIRLCIYGYKAFGYQNINSYYNKNIIKLINNAAKLLEPIDAYIKIDISINNGQDLDNYIIQRGWNLAKNNLVENIVIYKNNILLNEEEIADFEKFIMQIIPPDLFDLYFFDGEKIADFFLEEGSKIRLKNAFLTLCGYDIFDIMNKNFKRILASSTQDNVIIKTFLELHEKVELDGKKLDKLKCQLLENYSDVENIDSEIKHLDDIYKKQGGVSKKEWDKKFQTLRDEERFREEQNAQLKKVANDILPFLILKKELLHLNDKIQEEIDLKKYSAFNSILKQDSIIKLFENKIGNSKNIASILNSIAADVNQTYLKRNILLDLSTEQSGLLQYQINKIFEYDPKNIAKYTKAIKDSIKKSQNIRDEIEKCNIDKIDDYANQKSSLLDKKSKLLNNSVMLGNQIQQLETEFAILNSDYQRAKKNYESELKKNSINDISAKAVLMLEQLEKELYQEQIKKVENTFKQEIDKLMRKVDFINDIKIDSNFNITLYRKTDYSLKQIKEIINNIGLDGIESTLGNEAYEVIKNIKTFKDKEKIININVELDKTSFSNGEKQIFIMALYKSLMSLCRNEVPFVIDTPFARIDTEHRNNISKHFFKELKGQVFILSTNEEIENKQLEMLENKLAVKYMLENQDNKSTKIKKNLYFAEV